MGGLGAPVGTAGVGSRAVATPEHLSFRLRCEAKASCCGGGGGGVEGNGMVTAGTAQRWEPMRRHRNTSKQGAREPGEGGERDTCGRATFPPGPRRSLENGRERA